MLISRLKILRQQYGLTQGQLAKKLGVSASTVGMYEQGRREPDHQTLLLLCRTFGISTDYLLGLETQTASQNNNLTELMQEFERNLMEQDSLMFNGILLDKSDVRKIVDAMKIGAEIAKKESKRNLE